MNLGLTIRTIIHLKPVQIWNRIWRKRLSFLRRPRPPASTSPLPEFEFLNVKGNPNGWNDPRFEKLWLYNLHYFDYLNNEVEGRGERWKLDLVLRWIQENPVGCGNGWEPYPISLRVVNWIKWLDDEGREEDGHKEHREHKEKGEERIEESLREQMNWLYPRLEYHLLANHLLANAKALVFAGVFLENEKWYKKGMAIYRHELPEQTCGDGVHFERSPMYHCIILEDVLDCYKLIKGRREQKTGSGMQDAELFKEYAGKMLVGLKMLVGSDGKIAKFNDSSEGIAKSPANLFAYAATEGFDVASNLHPPTFNLQPSPSGFLRLENQTYCMLAKCGEIGPSYQPGHAHADTWSFELWKKGRKVIGDTGCSTYVPGPVRSYERSTAAHNTVVIDGQDSSEVWAAHRVGRRFDFGRHRRRFELTAEGLKGVDEVFGHGEHDLEVRFHLPPGVGEEVVKISCNGDRRVEPCEFAVGWNRREPGLCIIYHQIVRFPATFTWSVS